MTAGYVGIAVDGRVLNRPNATGVERYTAEIVRALEELNPLEILRPRNWGASYDHLWIHTVLPARALLAGARTLFCPVMDAPACAPSRLRVVVTIHDLNFLRFPNLYNRSFRRYYQSMLPLILRRADAVISISEYERQHLVQLYPLCADKVEVVHHGIAPMFADASQPRLPQLLAVASPNKHKNLTRLVQAFSRIKNRIPHQLVLVGGDRPVISSDESLGPALKQLEAEARVTSLGYVGDAELIRLYQTSELFVFPSLFEGFGFPPLEAMACGCPVAVSNTSSMPEICGQAAVYFDPYDIDSIAQVLEHTALDADERMRLAAAGKQRAAQFTWPRAAQRVLPILTGSSL